MIKAAAAARPIASRRRFPTSIQSAAIGSLGASFAGQLSVAVSGVLVARMLGVENRGYLALLVLWPAILSRLGGLGLPLAAPYFIARDPRAAGLIARKLIAPVVLQTAGLILVHGAILIVLLTGRPGPIRIAGLITLVSVPLSLMLEYGLAVLQGQQRYAAFNILRAAQPVLYAVGVAGAFLIGKADIVAVVILLAFSGVFATAFTLFVAWSGLPRAISGQPMPSLTEMLRFGLKGLLGSVSPIETFRLDQAIIGLLLSPSALGIYVVAVAFTNLPRFVAQSIGLVAYPHIAGESEGANRRSILLNFLLLTMAITVPIVAVIGFQADHIVRFFFGIHFASAADITRVLIVGGLFYAARRVLTDGLRGAGAPAAGTLAEIASWIWLLPAVVVLAPRWGIVGVAWAFTSSAAFSFLILAAVGLNFPRPYRHVLAEVRQ